MIPSLPLPLARRLAPFAAAVAALLVVGGLPTSAGAEEVRRLEQTYFAGDAKRLQLDITLGSVRVEGVADATSVTVEMVVTCSAEDVERCRRKAERLTLGARTSKDTLDVRIRRTPRGRLYGLDAEMVVKAPWNLALEIDVTGGDVFVENMVSHLEVDTGGGDVDVVYPQDRVKRVNVDVGLGNAELWLRDGKVDGRGFPRSIDWTGSGVAVIEIDLGGGDARVRLN